MFNNIVFYILGFHILGAIVSIIYCNKKGIFQHATKTGDGIRFANASDIMFYCIILWEFFALDKMLNKIEKKINNYFLEEIEEV